jgi:hypothetical protein
MSRNPQPLRSLTIPTYRQILLFELYESTRCVKTFDPATLSLVTYHWYVVLTFFTNALSYCLHRPVQGQRRVTPDAWCDYRKSHEFLGPCCLCPLLTPASTEPRFIEAAIYIPILGRYTGEYVAACAKSRCGYIGQSLFTLEIEASRSHPTPAQYHWREYISSSGSQ